MICGFFALLLLLLLLNYASMTSYNIARCSAIYQAAAKVVGSCLITLHCTGACRPCKSLSNISLLQVVEILAHVHLNASMYPETLPVCFMLANLSLAQSLKSAGRK